MRTIDRYSLLCFSVSLILLMTIFVNSEEPEDDSIVGIVFDVKGTQNGYTFSLEDSEGNKIRCFTRIEPIENNAYMIKGSFSDDGNIFFVNMIRTADDMI